MVAGSVGHHFPSTERGRHIDVRTATQFTVAIAQLPSVLADVEANWARAVSVIDSAREAGAKLVVFPECFLQGYRADHHFAATAIDLHGEFQRRLVDIAWANDMVVIMGVARCDAEFPHLVYNSAAIAGPDGLIAIYDKTHLGTYLDYREGVFFAPGKHLCVVDLPFARVGVQICYDISFPEVSRVLALAGADVNVVLSAGPDAFRASWGPLLRVRSSENLFWSVYANSVGEQAGTNFFGESRVVGPDGSTRVMGPLNAEACVTGVIDLDEMRLLRRQTLRFRDRTPELYSLIAQETSL